MGSDKAKSNQMKAKYIEVIFHDNDFGQPVKAALVRLWGYISENNGHLVPSLIPLFVSLHRVGALADLFERLYVLEYLAGDVEFKTRGLYWDHCSKPLARYLKTRDKKKAYRPTSNFREARIKDPGKVRYENTYLKFKFHFRQSDKFTKKWQNGEHAYLNMETGEVGVF